jgi:hypothetical protein
MRHLRYFALIAVLMVSLGHLEAQVRVGVGFVPIKLSVHRCANTDSTVTIPRHAHPTAIRT